LKRNCPESDSTPDPDCDDVELDVDEDMCISQTLQSGLRTFNNVAFTPTSPFVKVPSLNGGEEVVKKSTYCWLLSKGHTQLSNDRLQRVKAAGVQHKHQTSNLHSVEKNEEVAIGQWCAFVSEERRIIFGRILSFSFLGGSSWKNQEYSGNSAAISRPAGERDVGCLCSWFAYKSSGRKIILQDVSLDLQGYFDIKHYICNVPRPTLGEDGKLALSCCLKDIRDLAKGRLVKKCVLNYILVIFCAMIRMYIFVSVLLK